MRHEQGRLFDPKEYAPRVPKRAHPPQLYAVADPSQQVQLGEGGARVVLSAHDGLPVREVKPHSALKARMVSRDLGTVGRAMNRKWFDVHYLELYSGPGRLLDEISGEELPGSPLQALAITSPFDRYVFSDHSNACTEALGARIAAMRNETPGLAPADVLTGDANDPAHLESVCALIDEHALVIAYLDPAKPNLDFATVRFLAQRFRHLDLIINLPVSGIHRSLAAGGLDGPRRMLEHPHPEELLHSGTGSPADAIRAHYDERLHSLGMEHITRRCVRVTATNSPLYDIVLASRNPTAVKLWDNANREPKSAQLDLSGLDAS